MQVIAHENTIFVLRFDPGEDVMQELISFTDQEGLTSGVFQAIGAAKEVLLSYYNLSEKIYEDHGITKEVEIVSMSGNIAHIGKNTVIHAHGVFADKTLNTVGGHIKKLIVSATCEVTLQALSTPLKRSYDAVTGLNLLSENS